MVSIISLISARIWVDRRWRQKNPWKFKGVLDDIAPEQEQSDLAPNMGENADHYLRLSSDLYMFVMAHVWNHIYTNKCINTHPYRYIIHHKQNIINIYLNYIFII